MKKQPTSDKKTKMKLLFLSSAIPVTLSAYCIHEINREENRLNSYVELPDIHLIMREEAQDLLEASGLQAEFVEMNLNRYAQSTRSDLSKGITYLDKNQSAITYIPSEEGGGYYVKKGAVIVVGYTSEDFVFEEDEDSFTPYAAYSFHGKSDLQASYKEEMVDSGKTTVE